MESGLWELLNAIMKWMIWPFMLIIGHFYKKHTTEITALEREVTSLKISHAVTSSQVEHIREDIKELSTLIKDSQGRIREDLKALKEELKHYDNSKR